MRQRRIHRVNHQLRRIGRLIGHVAARQISDGRRVDSGGRWRKPGRRELALIVDRRLAEIGHAVNDDVIIDQAVARHAEYLDRRAARRRIVEDASDRDCIILRGDEHRIGEVQQRVWAAVAVVIIIRSRAIAAEINQRRGGCVRA